MTIKELHFNIDNHSNMDKVAIVTGSNKGIGYGIVKELCRRDVSVVYLTARDILRGEQAVENLKNEGFNPVFHQLDVTEEASVKQFANHLKLTWKGLDILINNAAVIPEEFKNTTYEDAKRVIDVNYKSYFYIQQYIFPILKDNARVINISSDCGHISNIKNPYWIKKLTDKDIKVQDINDFVDWFLDSVKKETLKKEDFAATALLAYRISKIAICALTRIQQREIGRGISINSLHPGFVKTDLTKHHGDLTIEEASQAPVYLALDCDQSVKGRYYWYDKTEKDWADPNIDLICENKEEVNKYFDTVQTS